MPTLRACSSAVSRLFLGCVSPPQELSFDCSVTGNAYIWALAFSPADNRLAVGSWNGHVHVYKNELVHDAANGGGGGGGGGGLRREASTAGMLCARRRVNELACLVEDRSYLNDAIPRVYSLAMTQVRVWHARACTQCMYSGVYTCGPRASTPL